MSGVLTVLKSRDNSVLDFKDFMSAIAVLYACLTIIMLQRTQSMGDQITMMWHILNELYKFMNTFGLLLIAFLFILETLKTEFMFE